MAKKSSYYFYSDDNKIENELFYATVVIDLSHEGRSTYEVQNHIHEYTCSFDILTHDKNLAREVESTSV